MDVRLDNKWYGSGNILYRLPERDPIHTNVVGLSIYDLLKSDQLSDPFDNPDWKKQSVPGTINELINNGWTVVLFAFVTSSSLQSLNATTKVIDNIIKLTIAKPYAFVTIGNNFKEVWEFFLLLSGLVPNKDTFFVGLPSYNFKSINANDFFPNYDVPIVPYKTKSQELIITVGSGDVDDYDYLTSKGYTVVFSKNDIDSSIEEARKHLERGESVIIAGTNPLYSDRQLAISLAKEMGAQASILWYDSNKNNNIETPSLQEGVPIFELNKQTNLQEVS